MQILIQIFSLFFILLTSCTASKQEEPEKTQPVAQTQESSGTRVEIKGRVLSTKTDPGKKVQMNADAVCAKAHGGKPFLLKEIEVDSSGGLKNALVYLKEAPKTAPTSTLPSVELDQKNCLYSPVVLGVQVNQPISIKNSDPTLHNVNAQSKVSQSFNFGMATQGSTQERKFTKPEVVKVKCDVHGWMNAWIGVFDHPYFAVTNEKGEFTISNIPSGNYTVVAWHSKLGNMEVTSTATTNQVVEMKY